MSDPKVVKLTYELRTGSEKGEVIEKTGKDNPVEFLFGVGNFSKEFEGEITPLKTGEEFNFTLDKEYLYGESNPQMVVDMPRSAFIIDGKEATHLLVVGNVIRMRDHTGKPIEGKVLEVNDETVKMDFNHPLAGLDLNFQGEIVEIRDASAEEVEHKHVHTGKDGH